MFWLVSGKRDANVMCVAEYFLAPEVPTFLTVGHETSVSIPERAFVYSIHLKF